MKKIKDVLKTTTGYLNGTDIDYVFVGGIAVIVYGNPRTTVDLDLIVQMDEEDIDDFASYLRKEGFLCDPSDMKDAFRERTHFSAEEKGLLFRLYIKGVYDPGAKRTLRNKRKVEYDGIKMYVASPEDTISHKLLFGGEQDIEDAESIYVRQDDKLDHEYLEKVCHEMGVGEELEEMKKEIEELME